MLTSDAVPVIDIPRHRMNDITAAPQQDIAKLYRTELPNSQDSIVTAASSTFSAPALPSSSSNLSNFTIADVEVQSSATSYAPSSQSQPLERAVPPSPAKPRSEDAQRTPPAADTVDALRAGDTAASPMSLDPPMLVQGSKRTASGMIKGSDSKTASPMPPASQHKRTKSTESGSHSRIGEISAQLRTRLSYAMVKVQNGWEKKSLDDIEDETSQRGSPISAPSRSENIRVPFGSPRDILSRRPSAISVNSDQMMLSPGQASAPETSRSLGTTPTSYWGHYSRPVPNGESHSNPANNQGNGVLAPPAEIGSRRKRRSSASFQPPSLLSAGQRKYYSDLGTGPHTPGSGAPRPGILRMPSQQAEKDAVDTLLFMSSPNNTGRLAHANSNRSSKPALPTRRVMFESDIQNSSFGNGQQPIPGPYNHSQPEMRRTSYARTEPGR